ncbi:DUF2752 domain-containing protein [Marilutibacter alkalisoli]|uniref:DUF2752 domain-containing protein n=1 Tax=Marilutibacter alkalisoli TaxID=2591633 RepID=A0A514BNZ5_9GAMM|nr:DUF2752 domain-containing protein [Lysobacter alkalisoli]
MILPALPRHRWMLAAATAAAAFAAFGVWALRNFDPNAANSPFLGCLFLKATGLYCPGCGTTRGLHALVHGDLGQMVAMNPLLPLLMVAVPLLVLHGMGRRVPLPAWLMAALNNPKLWLVLLIGYWIARNLPWWPFSWLAPG